jgi:6-phosphogluconolactonase
MMKRYMNLIYAALILLIVSCYGCKENKRTNKLFVGKSADSLEEGLYIYNFDNRDGTLQLLSKSDAGPNPTYFCFSGKRNLVYAANEVTEFNGQHGGGITTLMYDNKNDRFEKLNEIAIPNGGPCYISVSPEDDFLFIANYSGGSIVVVKLDAKGIPEKITDTIIYDKTERKVSHAHMIMPGPAGKKVYMTDLGLDRIMIYDLDRISGKLTPYKDGAVYLPEGTGPRHFTFSSDGKKMYVIAELNSTITVFDVDQNGDLMASQSLTTVAAGFKGRNACADIHIGKSGEYLYGSNRGENSIVTFKIGGNGLLELAGHTSCGGTWPRNFVIDPTGRFILVGNQRSGNISILKIDKKTGIPLPTEQEVKIPTPACLKFSSLI